MASYPRLEDHEQHHQSPRRSGCEGAPKMANGFCLNQHCCCKSLGGYPCHSPPHPTYHLFIGLKQLIVSLFSVPPWVIADPWPCSYKRVHRQTCASRAQSLTTIWLIHLKSVLVRNTASVENHFTLLYTTVIWLLCKLKLLAVNCTFLFQSHLQSV